jgi:peptidoglycan/LPS O-acetylase OafA/YrhL
MGKPTGTGRIPELDSVRAFAAIAVLITHLPYGWHFGETGVDLFFVLSGYLITGIILRDGGRPGFLRTFYLRRSLRIWPIYYLTVLAVAAFNLLRHHPAPLDSLPWLLTYTQNVWMYWGGTGPNVNALSLGHTWTLAIDEQFYLLWPALLLLCPRRLVPYLAGLFVVLPLGLRFGGLPAKVLLGHTDGLALGALLAWLRLGREGQPAPRGETLAYLAVCMTALAGYAAQWAYLAAHGWDGRDIVRGSPLGITFIGFAYFGLVGLVATRQGSPRLAWLRLPALVYLGQISYGLYLYHWILYEHLDSLVTFRWGLGAPWWLEVIKFTAPFVVAVLSWHLLEKPILKLKDRFSYRLASPRPVEAPGGAAIAAEVAS